MIFDTSSIYKAVEKNRIEKLLGEKTLDLASYELGNIIWKYTSRKIISLKEGFSILSLLEKVLSLMEIVRLGLNENVYELAVKNNISYYDASFIYAAISKNEAIVSEDKKLQETAKSHGIKAYELGRL